MHVGVESEADLPARDEVDDAGIEDGFCRGCEMGKRGEERRVCVEDVRRVEQAGSFFVDPAAGGEDGRVEGSSRRGLVVVPHVEVVCFLCDFLHVDCVWTEKLDVDLIPQLGGESEEQGVLLGICGAGVYSQARG